MTDPGQAERDVAEQLADDLSRLLSGEITEREFRDAWQRHASSACLETVWGNLEHYLADADIRARDAAYRAMQDAELTKLIRLLREGGPNIMLSGVTFLGSSGQ